MMLKMSPPSAVNVRAAGGVAGCCAGAVWGCVPCAGGFCCWDPCAGGCWGGVWAHNAAGASATARAKLEILSDDRIRCLLQAHPGKELTLSHEDGHYFIGHQHSRAREPQPRAFMN